VWIFVATMSRARAAQATERVRSAIDDTLSLTYEPPCSLCHIKGNTGSGTAITPFARSLAAHGMKGSDRTTAGTAMLALQREQVDSDRDGASDADELIAGTDPNSASSVPLNGREDPGYGCGGTSAQGSARDVRGRGASFAAWVIIALARLVRRSSRERGQDRP
jgi:hypothetical protein